jgi:hypothetical protein
MLCLCRYLVIRGNLYSALRCKGQATARRFTLTGLQIPNSTLGLCSPYADLAQAVFIKLAVQGTDAIEIRSI